jgi:NAD(P)-dependent dehydrogenase (short-subunit alcohol dehydrogenase family)
MTLEGKVVLVPGAARGMGREYVRALLKDGAKVIATDISWAPTGVSNDDEDFGAELAGNPNALVLTMDITLDSHVKAAYRAAMDRFGTVDAIINNGGIRQRDLYPPHGLITILETEVSEWQKMFDTHVFGTLRVIKTFVQPMLGQKSGAIVQVCSGGFQSNGGSREGSYQPAKAAEMTMAIYLANELKDSNIAVNVLQPGGTASTGTEEQDVGRREIRAQLGGAPLSVASRRWRPEHVVPLAMHLAEQDASGITGQIFNAPRWNQEHELGGFETWGYGPDVEAHRAAGTL